MLAAMSQLQEENGDILLPMSDEATVVLNGKPNVFDSPVSYRGVKELDVNLDEYYEDGADDSEENEFETEAAPNE